MTWYLQQWGMYDQQRLRPVSTYPQFDQSHCWSLKYFLNTKVLTKHHLEPLSLRRGCTGSSESDLVKIPHCWKSHVMARLESLTHPKPDQEPKPKIVWALTRDFHQCDVLARVASDEPVQPPFKLRISKHCSVSSLTLIEYSSNKQRSWSDCNYAQADLRLCWSHIPHCWKSHALAQIILRHHTNVHFWTYFISVLLFY